MKHLAITILLLASSALAAEPYHIVSVRVPWSPGNPGTWTNVDQPTAHKSDISSRPIWNEYQRSVLVRINPDGTEEVLVDPGDGGILDPAVDPKGEWVYYAKAQGVFQGWDIYKLNLATKEEIRLTNHEWTPPRSVAYGAVWNTPGAVRSHAPSNINPMVMGDRVIFCSNRDSLRTNGSGRGSDQCFLIYAMDTDGKNVERIGAWHLGGVLQPEKHPNGTVVWSTNEKMGYRDAMAWGLWAYNPDGTNFEPIVSAYVSGPIHGHTCLPDGRVAWIKYYSPRNGTGALFASNPFPKGTPAAPPRFGFPPGPNGEITRNGYVNTRAGRGMLRMNFLTAETKGLTEFTHDQDEPALTIGGVKQGFVVFPSAAPNGILMTWTGSDPTPEGTNPRSEWKARGRIMRLADNKPVATAAEMVPVFEHPNYSYLQPKAVVPEAAIYPNPIPVVPWIANDGSKCPTYLPKGSPFALVGSASTIARELMQWKYGGTGGQIPAVLKDEDIRYVRIYLTRPSPVGHVPFDALARERLDILCDIPVRHEGLFDADGNVDTSWLALIPGDTPFTLALLNANKEQIGLARTWHGLRPGEVNVGCGGCHKHTKGATNWESTLAFRHLQGSVEEFIVANGTKARTIQLERDVQPTLTALGLTVTRNNGSDGTEPADKNVHPGRALRSSLYTSLTTATPEQKELLAAWIDSGAGKGPGMLVDDLRPVLTVQEPGREQRVPITAIRFGAYDVHSGIAAVSVKASFSVNGRGAGSELSDLFTTADSVWSLTIPEQASGEVTVKVTDKAGNSESLTRTLKVVSPNAARIAAIKARLAEIAAAGEVLDAERATLEAELVTLGAK